MVFKIISCIFYFYPRPPRGGRQVDGDRGRQQVVISIHALREEGDPRLHGPRRVGCISIHALREEGDLPPPPLWPDWAISIHALREEGDLARRVQRDDGQVISIHALREEGDGHGSATTTAATQFLSTPSARRATPEKATDGAQQMAFLSTPSARRATMRAAFTPSRWRHFYPRPPRGGRLGVEVIKIFLL